MLQPPEVSSGTACTLQSPVCAPLEEDVDELDELDVLDVLPLEDEAAPDDDEPPSVVPVPVVELEHAKTANARPTKIALPLAFILLPPCSRSVLLLVQVCVIPRPRSL